MTILNLTPAQQDLVHTRFRMTGIPAEFAHRFDDDQLDNLEGYVDGHAINTLKSLRRDLGRWFPWCLARGIDPFSPAARDVRDFLRAFGCGRHPDSLRRMLSNINVFLTRIVGGPNVTSCEMVHAEIAKTARAWSGDHRQALAIRRRGDVTHIEDEPEPFSISRMVDALEPYSTVREIRSRFILSLGGDTGRRAAEYMAATMGDITEAENGEGLFVVVRSKTDQEGEGITKLLSVRTMRFYRQWRSALAERGVDIGPASPLLRGINMHGTVGTCLWPSGFRYVVRCAVREALRLIDAGEGVIDYNAIALQVGGHSFRVGLAQDLAQAGEGMPAICNEGGWKDDRSVIKYVRNIAPQSGAMARLRRRLGDE
ncbi:hypothetical protein E2E30_08935 [Sphingomonas sp. AAP5]|uniref:tyrosine-type recombinase/integrase n=1 Tax=Sphingomonas sp. AAP5 TaxID=1523415 RepID=UPI001057391F|nr:tyrosine-type recombinase/integrase [Sphingomonas sp. AAP5]QBM75884.1 hypothetical protein E2E30_08935 [Sphingomonas sp. AAP5]